MKNAEEDVDAKAEATKTMQSGNQGQKHQIRQKQLKRVP